MVQNSGLIPGFEILERVGSGGVAAVFRARRLSDSQEVALKVTSLGDLDPEFRPVERFQREGQLLTRLNHPTLPRLFGYGVTDGNLGWLALELVQGEPLSSFAGRPVAELLPIFVKVAECLEAITQEGIVHRDISPDNILVEDRFGRPHPRLIDFGVAKDLFAEGEDGNLTRHGAFLGKLVYASPEQLIGLPKGQTIDFRSDVYSLGLVFHELLTGEPPIKGESLPAILDAHMKGFLPPIVVPPERGGPATRLVQLVARMTAKKRDDRPASWEEVLAELWRSREEVSPLAATLARRRIVPAPDDGSTRVRPAPPEPSPLPGGAASPLRRVTLGQVVLGIGAVAFACAVAFAVFVVRAQMARRAALLGGAAPVETPAPGAASGGPAAAATASPASPASSAAAPAQRPRPTATKAAARATPTQEARPAPAATANGVLEVSLLPSGELVEVTDAVGTPLVGRRSLPARLELPPGRYRVRLASPALDCERSVAVTLRPGRTTAVKESCIEVK